MTAQATMIEPILEKKPAQFQSDTLLVAHELSDGSTAISQLSRTGALIQRFGVLPAPPFGVSNEFRAHLALSGGVLFRTNGVQLNTISDFNPDGTLAATITPSTSPQHKIIPIARDLSGRSIYIVDSFAGNNVIRHLDDILTGACSPFTVLQYPGMSGIVDMYCGGPRGHKALYALTATSPAIVPGANYRVAKIDPKGTIEFIDNPKFTVTYLFDVGSVAVAPSTGNIYVANTSEVVELDALGTTLNAFAFVDAKPSLDVAGDGSVYIGYFESTTGQVDVFQAGQLVDSFHIPDATKIIDVLYVQPDF
ncbi:MAG TPA: hypothetical protein VJA94_22475 [Candidatus Angelobacter sp.]